MIWARGTLPSTRTMYQGCSEVGGLLDDLVAVFRGLEVIQDRCPYAETVSVSALMDPNWSEPLLADRRFAEGGPRIDLNDKVVLYGASLESFPDLISAPTHRRPLPGVYFHAMALDNLLSFGAHYKSDTSRYSIVPSWLANSLAYCMLFFIPVLIPVWLLALRNNRQPSRLITLSVIVLSFVIQLIILAIFAGFCFFLLDLAPINWIGIAITAGILPVLIKQLLAA